MRETLEKAIRSAGNLIREKFGRILSVQRKEDHNSIVTEVDTAAEKLIVGLIEKRFPDHNILAEESGFRDRNSKYTWVIDPLDGTSNYAAGLPWFGVMGAVLEKGAPLLGMIYLPLDDLLYVAEENKGATCNGDPVKVTGETDLENVLCAYALDSCVDNALRARQMKLYDALSLRTRNLRATNCLIDFTATIEGKLGAAVNHCTRVWDIAAIQVILQEAGGRLSTLDGNPVTLDLDPATACTRNYAVIGASPALTTEISRLWSSS